MESSGRVSVGHSMKTSHAQSGPCVASLIARLSAEAAKIDEGTDVSVAAPAVNKSCPVSKPIATLDGEKRRSNAPIAVSHNGARYTADAFRAPLELTCSIAGNRRSLTWVDGGKRLASILEHVFHNQTARPLPPQSYHRT